MKRAIVVCLGGLCDLSVEVRVLSVASVGRPLRSLCFNANLEPACMQRWVGSASMENRDLPLHAAQNALPSMVPTPILCHPGRMPPPLTPSSLGAGYFSSGLSEVCMAEQRAFYPRETWNVSECSRLFSHSTQHCVPCFPRERERGAVTAQEAVCMLKEGEGGDSES